MTDLAGVVPIAVTPFDVRGRVDEESIATLVDFEARCGAHGLTVLGIMGEAHKLSEAERRRVAEVFLKTAAGRLPVVVGTSHGGTGVVIELSQAAAAAAAAVMVGPPAGLRGADAIVAHYREVGRAVGIPIVVQDEPVATGVLMPPELLARIAAEVEACRYVKLEEPPTPTKITALRRLPGGDCLAIFGGMNAMYFIEELRRGTVGIMTGFAPSPTSSSRDRLALRKETLRLRGAIASSFVRPPGARLDDVTRAELEDTLTRAGLLLR